MNHPHNKDTVEAIIELHRLNWSQSKISRAVGINRKRIARILLVEKIREGQLQDSLNGRADQAASPLEGLKLCLHCEQPFDPDPRHVRRQKFCRRAACKLASKKQSQRKWSDKNPDYWL
jgi:hypothetical protein